MDNQPERQTVDAMMDDALELLGASTIGKKRGGPFESHEFQRPNSRHKLPDMLTAEILSWDTPYAREREVELDNSYRYPAELSLIQDIYTNMTAYVVEWLQKECRNSGLTHLNFTDSPADLGEADVVSFARWISGLNIQIPYGIRRHWEISIDYRTYHLRYLRARLEPWDVRGFEDIERHQRFVDFLRSAYIELFPE